MTNNMTRTRTANHGRPATTGYPNDLLHPTKSYAETQKDIGSALAVGAITLLVLVLLLVLNFA